MEGMSLGLGQLRFDVCYLTDASENSCLRNQRRKGIIYIQFSLEEKWILNF